MYLCFIGIVVFSVVILARALTFSRYRGRYWIEQAKDQQQQFVEIDAERGTIYSEDGSMLSTSIPFFNIYIDFMAEGLRERAVSGLSDNVDSLSMRLAAYF